jgi:hypothetical protein
LLCLVGATHATSGEVKFINGVKIDDYTKCDRNNGDIVVIKPFPLKIGARVHGADHGDGWTQVRNSAAQLHDRSVAE